MSHDDLRRKKEREYLLCGLAFLPLLLCLTNLRVLARAPAATIKSQDGVSVLIPARNEATQIIPALESVLANGTLVKEILVLDDNSDDDTADRALSLGDDRIRILRGTQLLEGWCGKNHACAQLARAATQPWLLFIDADVRLTTDAVNRLVALGDSPNAPALLSGVPRQITATWLEWLLLPLINVLLFGYLPLALDNGRSAGLAAACGQLVMVRAQAYRESGGHGAIRGRLHDGLALARHLRRHGYRTRLIDATDLAQCRMYRSGSEVYAGLMKNAVEGMAGPVALPIWTVLLAGAHILPFLCRGTALVWMARMASLAFRLIVALRCHQGLRTALLSPIGVFLLLWIQFHARLRHLLGRPVSWKGRIYDT